MTTLVIIVLLVVIAGMEVHHAVQMRKMQSFIALNAMKSEIDTGDDMSTRLSMLTSSVQVCTVEIGTLRDEVYALKSVINEHMIIPPVEHQFGGQASIADVQASVVAHATATQLMCTARRY